MADRFIDFDAARAEREQEPLVLKAYGREFALPPAMPAALFLGIVRLEEERGSAARVSGAEAMRLMQRVLPRAVLDDLLQEDDFSTDDLVDLCALVMATYKQLRGGAPAPNRKTRRAK